MELLGNKSAGKDAVMIISNLNRHLLTSDIISDTDTQDLIQVLSLLADTNNNALLHNGEVSSLILLLMENENTKSVPIIRNLITEVKLKTIRTQCLKISDSDLAVNEKSLNVSTANDENEEDMSQYFGIGNKERFLPTSDNNFILPPEGEVTNLTVTEPNQEIGKNLIRELMIDHEGYVVEETSRRYEDIYTDESEEIYNNAHLSELRSLAPNTDDCDGTSNNVCLPAENVREQNYAGGARSELNS